MTEKKKKKGSFEDLEVWQEGCDLAVEIYGITRKGDLSRDYGFRDQMTRAAVSIPSNIAEGKERETVPELIRCQRICWRIKDTHLRGVSNRLLGIRRVPNAN